MTKKLYIRVDGIYCEHCIETIKLALRSLDGVKSATLRQNVAEISGESLPRADVIIDTIRRIGYDTDERKISANRCNNEIVSRDFGFNVPLTAGDNVIEFTPTEEGDYVYTCWMNMITNHIKVIDDIDYFR